MTGCLLVHSSHKPWDNCGRARDCEDMSISPQFFDISGRSVDGIDRLEKRESMKNSDVV
jgi:hypothetical protein